MPFEAPWMDPEIIILSEVREKQVLYDVLHIESKDNDTNDFM